MDKKHCVTAGIAVFVCALFGYFPAINKQDPTPATAAALAAGESKPQIVTDDKTNSVRVLIGGREIMRIDAKGLHVRGNIEYTGSTIDRGSAHAP